MSEGIKRKLKITLVTDVFPPGGGGSGWSAYYLGKALADLGHTVRVVKPVYRRVGLRPTRNVLSYGGLRVDEISVPAPQGRTTRTGLSRAWEERKAIQHLTRYCTKIASAGEADVIHGQHAVSGLATSMSVRSARRRGARVISVVTVRDYWPLCPSSTRLVPGHRGELAECSDCHRFSTYLSCLPAKSKVNGAARWLRTRTQAWTLTQCDAIVAVSDYVRSELARSGRFDSKRVHTIHNLVDINSVDAALGRQEDGTQSVGNGFLLFAGKLDPNKGAQLLPEVIEASGVRLPILFAGDGALQSSLRSEGERRGLDFRFLKWMDNDDVLRLMHKARCLLFPTCWQEPLSRVLLEGSAAGAAIVALDSGGTSDVLRHMESGWLSQDTTGFIEGVRRICMDDDLNQKLRRGARERAETRFAGPIVSRQVEDLYRSLLARLEAA